MAIDLLKKVTFVCPGSSPRRVIRTLFNLGVVEVVDAAEKFEVESEALKHPEVTTEEADDKLRQIDLILSLLDTLAPEKQGFFEGLTPLPLVVEPGEVDKTVKEFDLEHHYSIASKLDDTYRRTERLLAEIHTRLEELYPFEDLPFSIADFSKTKRTVLLIGYLPLEKLHRLNESEEPWDRVAWEIVLPGALMRKDASPEKIREAEELAAKGKQNRVRVVFAFLKEDETTVRKALSELGFEEMILPVLPGKVRDQIRALKGDLAEYEGRLQEVRKQVESMKHLRRPLTILKAVWLSNRNRRLASAKSLHGKWTHVLCGYVRERDIPLLEKTIKHEYPEALLIFEDPSPDEDVPVSLSAPRWIRPIGLLVEMFGLPPYGGFDPSPFLLFNFYVFFGICFSDVGYGLMLIATSAYLMSKTKDYEGVNLFARILFLAGCSTVVFGALLGSWFGDLYKPEFLGEGNLLLKLQQRFAILDPMGKPVEALAIALLIGMANQFYGIILKAYSSLRKGDVAGAVFDGLFWLITLPGLVIMATKLFMDTPPNIFRIGMWLFFAGAVGLVLTQGRDVKNPIGRILTGIVSLYGIVGSYGCTAFVGDTLSYGRLLALGLTTSIVAQTFNMMAGMVKNVPHVGWLFFILILVVGHVFNFLISLLGAFVHSMRLIFVEFFGRFYEGGARPFQPLGFDSPLCIQKKSAGSH
ncbi:MAG TPA: hypothetical protein PKY35_01400 [Candidatus Hydrogenedentes bacterium]|nr:hypothetical protein [Candidatus Hydrogenedentota bacterium]HOL75658.1 hypothetical protein [Candidatus Hydrogenedentota bacterium]HPO84349.1 hypothetical protein [Candidatus Hydrogenedentota bacterium]